MPVRNTLLRKILTSKRLRYTLGLMVLVFVLFNYLIMPAYVYHGGTLNVPPVVGLKVEQAMQVLDSVGLEPVQSDTRPDPKLPAGTVVAQNPQSDEVVKFGRRVYLSVSGGEVLVTVPPLRGRSARDAKFTLERTGLRLGKIDYATSEIYPENTIIEQSAQSGARVKKGTFVSVVISRGKVVQEIRVPELTGRSLAEAEKQLMQRGLKVGNITYQSSFELLPNTVVDQFPRSGDQVPAGQAVDLFVVKAGKPEDEIPSPKN